MQKINANKIIDDAKLTWLHWKVILLSALIIIFDGYDLVIYGVALPKLMEHWQLSPVTAGFIGSIALFGMMFGAIIFGSAADKLEHYGFSRKRLILICIIIFSSFTFLCGLSSTPETFSVFRFIAGLGLGGVMPNVIALMTEYAPKKLRSTLVTLTFSGYAVGGMSSALLGMWLVPMYGWQIMFYLAGIPLLLLPFIWKILPESIDYLVRQNKHEEVAKLLQQAAPEQHIPAHSHFVLHQNNQDGEPRSWKGLFINGRARVTLFFWISVIMTLFSIYALANWIPKLMVEAGYDLSTSLSFLLALNLGGIIGTVTGGYLADRFPVIKVLSVLLLAGACSLYLLSYSLPMYVLYSCIAIAGAASIGGQIILLAYIAQFYPSTIRSTGTGMALGVGRIGAMLGPILCGWIISLKLPMAYNFISLAIPFMIACFSIICIGFFIKSRDKFLHSDAKII